MTQIFNPGTGGGGGSTEITVVTQAGSALSVDEVLNFTGTGVATTSGSGTTFTVNVPGGGIISWTVLTSSGNPHQMAVNHGYVANDNATRVTLTLPATAAIGDVIRVLGRGSSGWEVLQNAGQSIHLQSDTSTVGVTGNIQSTDRYDTVELICLVANTEWIAATVTGNLAFT